MRMGKRIALLMAFPLIAVWWATGCRRQSVKPATPAESISIINAPVTGEVRRILVREGETISKDAPVVEIAIRPAVSATPTTNTQSAEQRASLAVQSAAVAVESARAEVVRTEAEVGRLTSLVSSGAATQAELDGARAEYERAQRQLQRAQDERRQAESALLAARQPGSPPSEDQAGEQIITVRAPSAGAVRTVTARAGERVNDGQALVTLTVTPQ